MVRTNPLAGKLARRIESLLDDARTADDADSRLALAALMLELHGVVDALDSMPILPPLMGGAPCDDDFEVIDPSFLEAPDVWPSSYDPDLDGFRWEPNFDGPLPLSVLAESAPFDADYDAWLDRLDASRDAASLWTEADQIHAHGCV